MTMESAQSWNVISGRCGACRKFIKDFGHGDDVAYGHCPVKLRSGSITSDEYKCDVYDPIDGVEKTDTPVRHYGPGSFRMSAKGPAQDDQPTRQKRRKKPTAVLRRKTREERDTEPITWGDMEMDRGTLRQIIREAIEDSLGITEVEMVDRFVGGEVTIEPGVEGTQGKSVPIDALFRKIVMVRDCLRVLEQKINTHPRLDDSDRVQLQQYITRAYGSLTTFNMLFKHPDDKFSGSNLSAE
jgi:hypothetical protein